MLSFNYKGRRWAARKSNYGDYWNVYLDLGHRGLCFAAESCTSNPADLRAAADRGMRNGEV